MEQTVALPTTENLNERTSHWIHTLTGPAVVILSALVSLWLAQNRAVGDFTHMLEPAQRLAAGAYRDIYFEGVQGTSLTGWLLVTIIPFLAGKTISSDQGAWVIAGLVAVPMLVASVRYATKALDPTITTSRAWFLAGLSLMLPTTLASWTEYYHPQDIAGVAVVIFALGLAAKNKWGWAGIVFAVAILTRQWAILPAVAIAPLTKTPKTFAKYAAGGIGAGLAGFLPLLLTGNPGIIGSLTGSGAAVTSHTIVGRIIGTENSDLIGTLRLTPFVIVVAVALWLTITKKGNISWLVPLAITAVATRMLFDVAAYTYYWAPLCILILLIKGGKVATPIMAFIASAIAWVLYPQLAGAGQMGTLLMAIWLPVLLVGITTAVWWLNDNNPPETQLAATDTPHNQKTTPKIWALTTICTLAILGFGINATATYEQATPDGTIPDGIFPETRNITTTGPPLQTNPDGTIIGTIPIIEGESVNNAPATIAPGTTTAILIVSHWCETCNEALMTVQKWVENTKQTPSQIAVVTTETNRDKGNWPPELWLASNLWEGTIVFDNAEGQAGKLLGGTATEPTLLIINNEGSVVSTHKGITNIIEKTTQATKRN